ncbi:transporter [Halobacteriales archaeon SW_7_65_23]|nr:MAG: transporter [Halobacteriales archaeon SW_7_65_23]
MEPVEVTSYAVHSLFAGFWTGSVLFVSLAVLPLARDGTLNAAPLSTIAGKLTTVSRTSALVLFLTGGHMAGVRHTSESLLNSQGGLFQVASLLAALLLVNAGLLSAANLGFL